MPDVSGLAIDVWRRNRDVYLNVWRSEVIWPFVEPFVTLLALGVGLGDFVEFDSEMDYMAFIGPAIIAVYAMWAATAECAWGSFFRMDQQGTFDAMIVTPVSVDEVSTGEILWGATRSVMSVFYVGIMVLAFGGFESPLALLIIPFSVLPGIMFSAISLCYTAVAKSISSLNYFFATYITPQFWLSGAFFPLDEMPGWVEVVAWFTPAYHVVEVYRSLSAGDVTPSLAINVAWITIVGAGAYLVALALMRRRLIK
jgi:lipooligosaccharide transport system permease protein